MFPGTKLSAGKTLTPILPSSAPAGAAALFQQVPGTAVAHAVALGLLPGFLSLHRAKLLFLCLALVWDGEGEMGHCSEERWDPPGSSAARSPIPGTLQRGGEGWGQCRVLQTSRAARMDIVITFGSTLPKYSCSFKDGQHFLGCLRFQGFCLAKAGKKLQAEQPLEATVGLCHCVCKALSYPQQIPPGTAAIMTTGKSTDLLCPQRKLRCFCTTSWGFHFWRPKRNLMAKLSLCRLLSADPWDHARLSR